MYFLSFIELLLLFRTIVFLVFTNYRHSLNDNLPLNVVL